MYGVLYLSYIVNTLFYSLQISENCYIEYIIYYNMSKLVSTLKLKQKFFDQILQYFQ